MHWPRARAAAVIGACDVVAAVDRRAGLALTGDAVLDARAQVVVAAVAVAQACDAAGAGHARLARPAQRRVVAHVAAAVGLVAVRDRAWRTHRCRRSCSSSQGGRSPSPDPNRSRSGCTISTVQFTPSPQLNVASTSLRHWSSASSHISLVQVLLSSTPAHGRCPARNRPDCAALRSVGSHFSAPLQNCPSALLQNASFGVISALVVGFVAAVVGALPAVRARRDAGQASADARAGLLAAVCRVALLRAVAELVAVERRVAIRVVRQRAAADADHAVLLGAVVAVVRARGVVRDHVAFTVWALQMSFVHEMPSLHAVSTGLPFTHV